ncbi:7TM domain-containing protein [Aurantiacibacter aquimixticola]|uniref:7TM domain-containing protein n=1 Tax=Aurantiacibacter aquimixticola TaxID=1958945 RepID=UPI001402418E|nr:7TM domain-containing protein [Aurantiacibacter aquimixticola]
MIGLLAALGISNTTNVWYMPQSQGETAVSFQVWGMRPSNLLMALPIGAFLVVLARSFVGMKAFGLFTPMLIAIAFLQIGPIFGPIVLGSAVGVGMLVAPLLLKLHMTRVGFLGVLISFVVFVLAGLQVVLNTELQVDAFPVVVTALVVERWYRQWERDGWKEAAWIAGSTFVLALMIQFVMVSRVALTLIEISPLVLPGFAGLAIALLGRYRGLRLSEIKRFAPIWLEGRRNARIREMVQEGAKAAELDPVESDFDAGFGGDALDAAPAPVPAIESAKKIFALRPLPVFPEPLFGRAFAFAGAQGGGPGRDSRHQPTQRDYREIQSALGDRGSAGQSGGQGRLKRRRRDNHGHDLRNLQLWRPA